MKKRLSVRVEESRIEKLRKVADAKKKTMTQLIEDWIDRLQEPQDKEQWFAVLRLVYVRGATNPVSEARGLRRTPHTPRFLGQKEKAVQLFVGEPDNISISR